MFTELCFFVPDRHTQTFPIPSNERWSWPADSLILEIGRDRRTAPATGLGRVGTRGHDAGAAVRVIQAGVARGMAEEARAASGAAPEDVYHAGRTIAARATVGIENAVASGDAPVVGKIRRRGSTVAWHTAATIEVSKTLVVGTGGTAAVVGRRAASVLSALTIRIAEADAGSCATIEQTNLRKGKAAAFGRAGGS